MANSSSDTTVSFPIFGLLGVLFVGLKLTGHIAWSWWWVLLPFYFWLPLLAVVGIIALIGYGVAAGLDKLDRRKRRKAREARLNARHSKN